MSAVLKGTDYVLHDGEVCHPAKSFDEYDDDLMESLCGKILADPIQALLLAEKQIHMTEESFGADPLKVVEMLKPLLANLRLAVRREFDDQ
jgi:hypothetical protein